jgi:HK97 family phage major capsid protein
MSDEIKGLIEAQGKAFEAFKETHEELKKNDSLTAEKLERIEKALDDATEAKTAIDSAFAAERMEREELEKKLNRFGIKGDGDNAKHELEVKTFNEMLAADAAEKSRPAVQLDGKGYDEYKAAFNSFLRRNERVLTAEEVKTLSVGSDPDGGYLVTPDVTGRMVTKVYETSPIRQIASIQPISTDALEGIEDLGEAGAGYAGEHTQGSDTTTPQIGKWRIPVHIIDTEPKTTQQLLDDAAVDVEAWLSGKVGSKMGRFENAEFVTGAANKIMGFTAGYTAASDSGSGVTWGTIGFLKSGANGDFVADASFPADKLFDLIGLLKNDYLSNAKFVTRRSVITKMRKFKDTTGQYLWQPSLVAGNPETWAGHAIVRAEDMPTLAANSLSLAFGDFAQAYQIVDRQGIRVLRDPYTSKPYVKFYTTKRTGGGVVNFEAIKLMKFAA